MSWLAQNWIWVVLGIGALFMLTRIGGARSCGPGSSRVHRNERVPNENASSSVADGRVDNLFDPVSGRTFAATHTPISTVYQGRAYFFENREDREAFKAAPGKFAQASPKGGQAIEANGTRGEQPRRGEVARWSWRRSRGCRKGAEMQKKMNVGKVERVVRVASGSALASWALVSLLSAHSLIWLLFYIALTALGTDFVVTGIRGYCPLYNLLGWSTAARRVHT